MQISVHYLRNNIKPARGCVHVKKNTKPYADCEDITCYVKQGVTGDRAVIRQQDLKDTDEYREQNRSIYRLEAEFVSAEQESGDQQDNIQDHSDRGHG